MILNLYDLQHNKIAGLKNYKDANIESVLSMGDKTLSFLWHSSNEQEIPLEGYIRTDTDEYVVKENSKSSNGYRKIVARLNLEEVEGFAWEVFRGENLTAKEMVRDALAGTGWGCISTVDESKRRNISLKKVSAYAIIEKIVKIFACEVYWDTIAKIVYLKERVGSDKGAYFIKGLNLKELSDSSDSYDFATRLVPIGADDLDIADINDGKNYVENYQYSSKVKTVIWEDGSYTDAQALKEDAEYKLKEISKPKKTYQAKICDLAKMKAEYSILEYSIGDTVWLVDNETSTREKQRITKTVEYIGNPQKNTCDISNTVLSFADMQKQLQETVECVENITKDNGTIKITAIEGVGISDAKTVNGHTVDADVPSSAVFTDLNVKQYNIDSHNDNEYPILLAGAREGDYTGPTNYEKNATYNPSCNRLNVNVGGNAANADAVTRIDATESMGSHPILFSYPPDDNGDGGTVYDEHSEVLYSPELGYHPDTNTIDANISGNATYDGEGNNIAATYATKEELEGISSDEAVSARSLYIYDTTDDNRTINKPLLLGGVWNNDYEGNQKDLPVEYTKDLTYDSHNNRLNTNISGTANKAWSDGKGNDIEATYATKNELNRASSDGSTHNHDDTYAKLTTVVEIKNDLYGTLIEQKYIDADVTSVSLLGTYEDGKVYRIILSNEHSGEVYENIVMTSESIDPIYTDDYDIKAYASYGTELTVVVTKRSDLIDSCTVALYEAGLDALPETKANVDGSNATGTWGISITGTANEATRDAGGNIITDTYATKEELEAAEVGGTIELANYAKKDHTHSEYAASSHGNHVPATQAANNAKFLRNDNTWQTVTPANIGAIAADNGFVNARGRIQLADLDTYSTRSSGTYMVARSGDSAQLTVFRNPGASASVLEIYNNYGMTELKVRSAIDSNRFTPWKNISFEGHTHSYLPLSGGTMSGNLNIANGEGGIWFENNSEYYEYEFFEYNCNLFSTVGMDGVLIGSCNSDRNDTVIPSKLKVHGDTDIYGGFNVWHCGVANMYCSLDVHSDLNVYGTKSRVTETENYNKRKLYCYEMSSPIFGDIGHGVTDDDGLCYIDLDSIFAETIDLDCEYYIFLQSYSENNVYVLEKHQTFFIIKGEPNTEFDWEVKAKQLGYSETRLEECVTEEKQNRQRRSNLTMKQ